MPGGGVRRRTVIAGGAVLAGAAAASAVWARLNVSSGIRVVDFSPGFEGLLSGHGAHSFRLAIGEIDITPGQGYPMSGYGFHARLSGGRSDRALRAQCALLRDPDGRVLVMVRVDAVGIASEAYRSILDRLLADKIIARPADFMINASHTHSGPALGPRPDPRILNSLGDDGMATVNRAGADLKEAIVSLVRRTHGAETTPVELGYTTGSASIGVYRWSDGGLGPTDLPVLVAKHAISGKLVAVLYGYACHPVCRGNDTRFDADFCGHSSALISAHFGVPALYFQGTAGNVDPPGKGKGDLRVMHVGQMLASAVIGTVERATFRPLEPSIVTAIEEAELPFAPDFGNREVVADLRRRYAERVARLQPGPNKAGAIRRHAELMIQLIDADRLPRHVGMTVMCWTLGDLKLVAMAHEVVDGYQTMIKQRVKQGDLWVMGYTNQVECYVPTDWAMRFSGYTSGWSEETGRHIAGELGSTMVYGWPAPFRSTFDAAQERPTIEQTVMRHIDRLLGTAAG